MPSITRILCPIDFSEPSSAALTYADDFASWVGADLVLLHAFDMPETYDMPGQRIPADPSVAERMEEIATSHKNISVTKMLHAGDAGRVICWAAENQKCELIIMGTHGRTGLRHLLMGSTAEYVLKHARCPVLTIRQDKKPKDPLSEPMVTPMPAPRYM